MAELIEDKILNMVGKKFGKWTVLDFGYRRKKGHVHWKCICECGNEGYIRDYALKNGRSKSCRECSYTRGSNIYYKHPDGYMIGITSKNEEFYFDCESFEKIKDYNWLIDSKGYVITRYKGKILLMHRIILDAPELMVVDHKNHITYDNRLNNIRICTVSENAKNKKKHAKNTKSKHKGLKFKYGKWEAYIMNNYKYNFIGAFENEIDAAKAYNNKALELFGEFAELNIIDEGGYI